MTVCNICHEVVIETSLRPTASHRYRCNILNAGWCVGACRLALLLLLALGCHLILARRSRYVRHRETVVGGLSHWQTSWRHFHDEGDVASMLEWNMQCRNRADTRMPCSIPAAYTPSSSGRQLLPT